MPSSNLTRFYSCVILILYNISNKNGQDYQIKTGTKTVNRKNSSFRKDIAHHDEQILSNLRVQKMLVPPRREKARPLYLSLLYNKGEENKNALCSQRTHPTGKRRSKALSYTMGEYLPVMQDKQRDTMAGEKKVAIVRSQVKACHRQRPKVYHHPLQGN